MDGEEQRKTGEPLSLSQILLSTSNPFASSTKDKSSSEQSKKRPVGPTSKYEFVRIIADNSEKHRRHKKTKKVADVGSTKKLKVPSSPQPSSPAMEKAKAVKASLSVEHPSFIKEMTPSDVTHHFFMRFPREFCKSHLPTDEETLVVLEDEKGKQYKTKYLPQWASLSAGWRRFAIVKSLREHDVLVFHLVQPCKFKVYILRTDDFDPVDKDVSISKRGEINLKKKRATKKWNDDPNLIEINISQEGVEATNSTKENHNSPTTSDLMFSGTISNLKNFNITTENHNSPTDAMFSRTIPDFRNFKIVVDNKTIDSKISKHIRTSYFVLCRSRKTPLHRHLIKGVSRKLAASIISEATNIAYAITDSKMSTPREDIAYWNTALQSFEFLGMDVGFIRARLDHLLGIARECSKAISDSKKNKIIDSESEVARIEEEIREHENKIKELKTLKMGIGMRNNESMDEIVEKFEVIYKEEAKAPWGLI